MTKVKIKRRQDSTFTKDEEIWIIKEFSKGNMAITVKRNFRKHFGYSRRLKKIRSERFQEVFDRFNKNGIPNIRKRTKLCTY